MSGLKCVKRGKTNSKAEKKERRKSKYKLQKKRTLKGKYIYCNGDVTSSQHR